MSNWVLNELFQSDTIWWQDITKNIIYLYNIYYNNMYKK